MKKHHPKTLSLQDLTLHQQRIRSIVTKISEYSPTFHINRNYNHSLIMQKIRQQREEHQDRILDENISIIQKLQNVSSKIDMKNFPKVNLTLRSKRKCNSLSQRKFRQTKDQSSPKRKTEDQIFQENLQMIDKLQNMDNKIKCWQDKSIIRSRVMMEKKQKQRRNEILEKFKEISTEMKCLRVKNQSSRVREKSPYINGGKVRKESLASFQTKANSFMTKRSPK